MTATDEQASASQGAAEALHKITTAYGYGRPLDAVRSAMEDRAVSMLNEARTPAQRAFAAAYDDASQSLLADLQGDADAAAGKAPMAASLEPGTPHADPVLAARGWHSNGLVYTRQAQPDRYQEISVVPDREAG